MWRNIFVALMLWICAFLAACGGGSMNTPRTVTAVPMSVTICATPPSGVAVLFFEALITGASLQPSDTSKSAVAVLTTPVEVEFGHLQTDTAFLSLTNIPPDTYKSMTLTFGNAVLTIVNHSGAAIGSCDSNTAFEDFDRAGCTASPQNFSCVMMGEIVEVDLSESGTGTMLAKRVKLEEQANQEALKATITTLDSSTQFQAVVFNEEPTLTGVSEGGQVAVTILPTTTFEVSREEMGEDGGFTQTGVRFASEMDLLVGQDVQIHPQMVASTGGITTITTDRIRLRPSQITGQVGMINSDGTFTLIPLSSLFTGATPSVTSIKAIPAFEMGLEDLSGLNGLAAGNTVSVKGLLFNTMGTPTLLAKAIRKQ